MKRRRGWIAGGVAALVIAAGTTYVVSRVADDGDNRLSRLAQFSDQGVTVTISIKDRTSSRATLVATLKPDRPGFHLYSVDLPADGINGVGRPITLMPRGTLAAAGPLTAEARTTTITLAGTDLTLPVYPDGPVTVDLPVTLAGHGEAAVLVGYAACSKSACLPPVSGHRVSLAMS
jgi:hypothetical protein